MNALLNKEKYIMHFQKKDYNYSTKNKLFYIEIKSLLIIIFFLLITKSLNTTKSETYTSFEDGHKITYLKKEMVVKFNLYINSCINDILIDKKKYPLVKNPKISAIIPIYNGGKYLHYSLRSIQNQKMKDIEIILIDDCSNDATLKIIEKYMKEDERIRLIKNIENRKILYSKSFAALNSKGKYIIELDQDDIFIRDDVFDILYYEAKKDDLDLVHIRDITKQSLVFDSLTKVNIRGRHYIISKKTHYKKQPELKDKMFIQGNYYLLWGLLIKSDIYKKAIYHLWPLIINYKIVYHEDYTITFMLIILAKKYKYLNHYAFIHLLHSNSTSHGYMNNNNYFLGVLFFGNTLFDYHINKNPKDIGIFIHFYKFSKKSMNKGKKIFPKLYNFLINNVIINQYISNEQRQFFQKNLNSSSKYIKNFEFEAIYNHQIANSNKKKRNKLSYPKISIIIFCMEYKYLDETINSIQNQNFSHYEIILIYDNKEQNDINLILKYSKENPNINIINNKNKKGILYGISIGVLSSKGKYILILEPSNILTKQNILNELYNIVSDGKTDILEFNLLINNQETINNNNLIIYKCSHFKSEFNLKIIKYNKNYLSIDQHKDLLINKLIKTDFFKRIIKEYNLNEFQREFYNYYDNIFLYILEKSKNKFSRTNIFGIIKNINYSNSLKINNIIEDKEQKIKDSIFYINFIFKNSYNSFEDKKFVLNEFFNVMSIIYNKFNSISEESYALYKNFMKCPYINKTDKKYLNFFYNSLIN